MKGKTNNELSAIEGEPNASDIALAAAAAAGDPAARRVMAERLLEHVRTTVRYLSGDDRDQDDWAQLSLIEIIRSARTYRGVSGLEPWADRITVRTTLRNIKRRRRRENVVTLDRPEPREPRHHPNADHDRLLLRRTLARMLGALSEERRTVVTLRLVHGYSISEIAELTETPANTVRDRLQIGRKQLRKKIINDPVLRNWVDSRES